MDIFKRFIYSFVLISIILMLGCQEVAVKSMQEEPISISPTKPAKEDPNLGPQSQQSLGEQRVLVVAVRFPDVQPRLSLQQIRRRAVNGLDRYVREQSYGLTWMKADFKGWVYLPAPVKNYKFSPYIYEFVHQKDRARILFEDAMTALEEEVDFSNYQHLFFIIGAPAKSEKGYGTACYCANPGLRSLKGEGYHEYAVLRSKGGKSFNGGIFVGIEIAHLGMYAHDFFHALGGTYKGHNGWRLVPCLYDFSRQEDVIRFVLENPIRSEPGEAFNLHTTYMGPSDIMSQHYYKKRDTPVGISSFTKIRLGWISKEQVIIAQPGDSAYAFLSPLSKKGNTLVVKIPLPHGHYYLIENRQQIRFDRILPDSGLLILKVNPNIIVSGTGSVRIMDAAPDSPHFSNATFRLDCKGRNIFLDETSNLAIIPLWSEDDNLGVLVTSIEKSTDALKAALAIDKLREQFPEPKDQKIKTLIEECIARFKQFEFKRCYQMAQQAF
jgi:hypothetical protein